MTPQIPGYLVSFESTVRPVVTVIVLSLIWLGAARMPASANSRYATAGVLSAVLIGWLAVAQYLGRQIRHFERAAAHSSRESRAGHIALPHFVRLYSTFGGTCG